MLRGMDFYRSLPESELMKIEKSGIYRWQVFFSRMWKQLLCGGMEDKLDFIQYLLNTICKRHHYLCKSRYYFDPICQVRVEADKMRLQKYTKWVDDGIFIFAGMPAYSMGGGQRSAQLAKNFSAMGKQVYYFFSQSFHRIPLQTDIKFSYQHQAIFTVTVNEVMSHAGIKSVFLFEAPVQQFLPYLEAAYERKIYTIYEHIDNWETVLGRDFYQDKLQQRFLETADVITVTSRNLTGLLKNRVNKKIYYLPNAVDDTVFNAKKEYGCPNDMILAVEGEKTILYFGSLWEEWIDWELIQGTARLCPECSFNMIGEHNFSKEDVIVKKYQNIHFLGAKNQQELPAYLRYCDFAIIPFRVDNIGTYVSPIKIFEYLAMDVKVITTSLPDVGNYPNTILRNTPEEWERVIHDSLKISDDRMACQKFVQENCWRARCERLLSLESSSYN